MRDAQNIREVSQLGVDMIGMIFYPKSPRYVEMQSSHAGIIPDYAKEDIGASDSSEDSLGNSSKSVSTSSKTPARVGVFVDDMVQNIVTRVVNYHLDYVQLHGNEPREMCENLRLTLDPDILMAAWRRKRSRLSARARASTASSPSPRLSTISSRAST